MPRVAGSSAEEKVLKRLREICLALPAAEELRSWGHPTFRVAKKTFCVLEEYKGVLSIALKVGRRDQNLFLKDPRFYKTPYIGKFGWVSLRAEGRLNWTEVKHLVRESHRLVAPAMIRDHASNTRRR